ncbi:flagellar biosynthesis protein FlgG [Paenibacillus odorifer]|uniref:flagellar hook-basal body protein n=1 Tax=Paenibacillus TaxID=44249 RepID=UPI0003E1FCF5|nr:MULTISPECIES: flagellar hook-basal body protein [Paenibacillus]ETT60665.1 flagellar hook-basal body protein [Paenibacillus sp. FSL H8-237]OME44858.1 flagellar biosynthesis protein FlgG [Paenibacillus odorifer]OME59241.1 flagellar biosynthesis protein FlgG [Paenibacillus odorifer]
MNNSTISAAVSMSSLQQRLDIIADNLANMDTNGYKSKQGSFEDVLTRVQQQSDDYDQPGRSTPLGFNMGFGTYVPSISTNWEEGPLKETGSPTDLAIQGNGLFGVQVNGTTAYTRQGDFHFIPDTTDAKMMVLVDNTGNSVLNTEGKPLTVPVGVNAAIDESGRVLTKKTENGPVQVAGTIMIVEPKTQNVLKAVDGNFYMLADGVTAQQAFVQRAAGEASGIGVRSGWLEQSNVDMTSEMTEMMQIQRTYQLVARALSSSDQMFGLANNMRA